MSSFVDSGEAEVAVFANFASLNVARCPDEWLISGSIELLSVSVTDLLADCLAAEPITSVV